LDGERVVIVYESIINSITAEQKARRMCIRFRDAFVLSRRVPLVYASSVFFWDV